MILDKLPDSASVWIYTSSQSISETNKTLIQDALQDFIEDWQSHGREVFGQAEFIEDRFLLIGAFIPDGDISGCGIDASTRAAKIALDIAQVEWVDNLQIAYRRFDGTIQIVTRPAFRSLVEKGEIQSSTPVFDLSVTRISDVRSGNFEKAFQDSWHGKYFVALPSIKTIT